MSEFLLRLAALPPKTLAVGFFVLAGLVIGPVLWVIICKPRSKKTEIIVRLGQGGILFGYPTGAELREIYDAPRDQRLAIESQQIQDRIDSDHEDALFQGDSHHVRRTPQPGYYWHIGDVRRKGTGPVPVWPEDETPVQ